MAALPALDDHVGNPFALGDGAAYRRWRDWKLATAPRTVDDLIVDVANPWALTQEERLALLDRIARANMAVYRAPPGTDDAALPVALGRQLGLVRLDANWLADDDGVSRIAVSEHSDGRGGFIPYTDRAIRWHTDGYYHPPERRIHGMILHCVRAAAAGGVNRLLDHEMAYIALRDQDPAHIVALMAADAMSIPAREGPDATDGEGVARALQTGPVFSLDADNRLHMRYTARTRSIAWKADAATRVAVAQLEAYLEADATPMLTLRLTPGMGIVANNVLHERSAFIDDPAHPRLLLRARFLDRVDTGAVQPWRNG